MMPSNPIEHARGAPVPLAYAIQGAATLVLAMASAWLWHGKAPYPLKAAGLCLAAILATILVTRHVSAGTAAGLMKPSTRT